MACLDMYNSEHKVHCAQVSPRISFSCDFVDPTLQAIRHEGSRSRETPASSDFEFSVTNYSMMSADELFSEGRILPFRDNYNNNGDRVQRTLRDELLADSQDVKSRRPPKGSTRWKGFLGLRRAHIGSKKSHKSGTSEDSASEGGKSTYVQEQGNFHVDSQELADEGGSSSRENQC